MLIAVNYHYIRTSFDQPYPSIFGVTPEQFRAQLETLGRAGEFVGAAEIRDAIRAHRSLPERCWAVTFDDGLREQHELAWPILRQMGIPAIFFINTDPIVHARVAPVHKTHLLRASVAPERLAKAFEDAGRRLGMNCGPVDDARARNAYQYDTLEAARVKYWLNFALQREDRDRLLQQCFDELYPAGESETARSLYMTREQVRELASHGCVGTHAHEHLPLGQLSRREIEHQLHESLRLLVEWTRCDIDALSYPHGSPEACTADAGEIAASHGICFAFTMERAGNAELDAPLFLSRLSSNDAPGGSSAKWDADTVYDAIPAASWHRSNAEVGA